MSKKSCNEEGGEWLELPLPSLVYMRCRRAPTGSAESPSSLSCASRDLGRWCAVGVWAIVYMAAHVTVT